MIVKTKELLENWKEKGEMKLEWFTHRKKERDQMYRVWKQKEVEILRK